MLLASLCPGVELEPLIRYKGSSKRGELETVFETAAKKALKTGDEGQMSRLDRLQVCGCVGVCMMGCPVRSDEIKSDGVCTLSVKWRGVAFRGRRRRAKVGGTGMLSNYPWEGNPQPLPTARLHR